MNLLTSYPSWWKNRDKSSSTTTYFYESAKGSSGYLARLETYYKVLDNIGELLSDDSIRTRYISEFISTNKINDFDLEVEALNLYRYSNSEIECIAKVKSSTLSLFSSVIDSEAFQSDMEKVNLLYNEGRWLYRNNDDFSAMDKFLEAALLLEKYPHFDGGDEFKNLSARIIRIAENSYISLSRQNPSKATCTISLKRRKGIIHPSILKGDIDAIIPSVLGGETLISYTTGPNGSLDFSLVIYDASKSGDIVFEIKPPLLLSRFQTEDGQKLRSEVESILQENRTIFSYDTEKHDTKNLDVMLLFFDQNGMPILLNSITDEFVSALSLKGCNAIVLQEFTEGTSSLEEIVESYKSSEQTLKSPYSLFVIGRVDDITPLGKDRAMHMSFDLKLNDNNNNKVLFESTTLDGNAVGTNERDLLFEILSKTLTNIAKLVEGEL